jgi:hypothetical protein
MAISIVEERAATCNLYLESSRRNTKKEKKDSDMQGAAFSYTEAGLGGCRAVLHERCPT